MRVLKEIKCCQNVRLARNRSLYKLYRKSSCSMVVAPMPFL